MSELSASSNKRPLSGISFTRPDSPLGRSNDSFVESQQCSADPSAFLGFHVPEEVAVEPSDAQEKKKNQTLKLVLDFEATPGDVTRGGDGLNPFNELFAGDTQDDEAVMMAQAPMKQKSLEKGKEVSPFKRRRENRNRSPSPPLTMLKDVEATWRARKEKENKNIVARQGEDSLPGASVYSEYSEDLAPRIFETTTRNPSVNEEKVDKAQFDDDRDRETDYEDEVECTQQLEDEGEADMTSYEGEGETEAFPESDAGTLPLGPDSTFMDAYDDFDGANNIQNVVSASLPEQKNSTRSEDEVTSREGSQATQQDYLTPRIIPYRVEQPDSVEMSAPRAVVGALTKTVEHVSSKSQNEDDHDECVPTQPSKLRLEGESVVEPNSPSQQNVLKGIDDPLANKQTDSQTKAIRTLEFSFSMPESQEGDPHFSASLTSDDTPATTKIAAFSRSDRASPFESSISPVNLSTPKLTPTPADDIFSPEASTATTNTQASVKRKIVSSSLSDLPSGKQKQKTSSESSNSPSQKMSTPRAKKRKRGISSPDNRFSPRETGIADPLTPRPPARRSTRSAQSTPSTPQVRTRTRTLAPVPSQRIYASRSRTLFKYKFEFCLTGFMKTGEDSLKELIEGHGGKIPERYQDVLFKNNPKAVVIATPVSWRKRKFMQAIACGIPVVHTDWIRDCIAAGYVKPFDGYQVPTGYSVTTRKFECFPPTELHIFKDYSFGIASDVSQMSKAEAKDKSNLMTFILMACGADAVYENLSTKDTFDVDIVLCDEYTPTCRYYKKRHHLPVKDFQWVTECMILQELLDPHETGFELQRVGSEDVSSASAEIGDNDKTTLKLYTGELVMADISGGAAEHYLLFNVCEILSIHVSGRKDEGSQSKRKDSNDSCVMLHVGLLKREPYNPKLSKSPVKELEISSSQVKRRVVAISKEDYGTLKYKDESIYYLEDASEPDKLFVSEQKWLTQ